MSAKLTRGTTRNVQPKLATHKEKEQARALMGDQIDDFFKRGGTIEQIPTGVSQLNYGVTRKQQEWHKELSAKGKKGAEKLFRRKRNESTNTQAKDNQSA
jgi:hypothetical protein